MEQGDLGWFRVVQGAGRFRVVLGFRSSSPGGFGLACPVGVCFGARGVRHASPVWASVYGGWLLLEGEPKPKRCQKTRSPLGCQVREHYMVICRWLLGRFWCFVGEELRAPRRKDVLGSIRTR